jgi:hypothetical protein
LIEFAIHLQNCGGNGKVGPLPPVDDDHTHGVLAIRFRIDIDTFDSGLSVQLLSDELLS